MTIEQIANNDTHYEHAKHKHYNHKNCSTCYTTNQHLPDYETSMAKMNLKNKKYAGKEISGEILNWVMRGTPKTITEVTSRLEELFDAKGNETGSKMVKQTITKGAK